MWNDHTKEFANTCTFYWEHHNRYHDTILFMMTKGVLQTYELYDEVERVTFLFSRFQSWTVHMRWKT